MPASFASQPDVLAQQYRIAQRLQPRAAKFIRHQPVMDASPL
jgi:hypothetical protein